LYDFEPRMLTEQVTVMNEEEQKIYPLPFSKYLIVILKTLRSAI